MTDLTKIYRDRCDAVGGNLVAGKFLHKLARWQHYTKITRDGFKWVAHTHAQWAEQTELTVDQIRRTLTRLGKEGLIVREQHIFRNKTVLFVRLSTSCLEALAPTQVAQFGAAQDAHDGATHIKPFKKPEKEPKTANGFAVAIPEEIFGEESEKKEGSDKVTAINDLDPGKVSTLEAVWQQQLNANGLPSTTITMKIRGQFKYLIKTQPEGTAPAFVEFAIKNWDDLIEKARKSHGVWKWPDVPDVDFLVKYANVVADLMKKTAEKAVQSIAQTPAEKNAA